MPGALAPMLASPAGTLPVLAGWTIEPKWDGVRVIADIGARGIRLWSRNAIDKSRQFPDISAALKALAEKTGPMVLDGEIVAVDRSGAPLRFQALQGRHRTSRTDSIARGEASARVAFIAFDCLWLDGRSLVTLPWTDRRDALESVVPRSSRAIVRRGDSFPCGSAGAKRLFRAARSEGWEGLILKHMDASYTLGKRSPLWRKVKLEHEQEFVIGGYTLPTEGADRSHLGALLVGYYDAAGALRYAGKVGTGFTRATLERLAAKLGPLRRATSPFPDPPRRREPLVWVRPSLVAQIRYNEMTDSGILRQPSFLGLRDDKEPRDVRLESETSSGAILDTLRCAS